MAEKYYKVTQSGLTIGTRVYEEGEVVKLDPENPRLSRSGRVFAERVEADGHNMLEEVDGRTKAAKENLVTSPEEPNLGAISRQTNTSAGKTSEDQKLGEEQQEDEPQQAQAQSEKDSPKASSGNQKKADATGDETDENKK